MNAIIIHKGEQFAVAFEVLLNDEPAYPKDIDGLRIKIGDRLLEYPGELEFDDTENVWLYPLSEQQTLRMYAGTRKAQIAVKLGDDILKTDIFDLTVKDSIITERWDNDG